MEKIFKNKKVISILLSVLALCVILIICYFCVAANYKKTYTFNPADRDKYTYSIEVKSNLNKSQNKQFTKNCNEYLDNSTTTFSNMCVIEIVIYKDASKTKVEKKLKCDTFKIVQTNNEVVGNRAFVKIGNEMLRSIIMNVVANYTFVEYPMLSTKNEFIATFNKNQH